MLRPPYPPALPRELPWGLLIVQGAILEDAAADVAGIGRRMAGAQTEAAVIRHGLKAVDLLDRTCRLLETQRAAMLERLGEVLICARIGEPERPGLGDPSLSRAGELGDGR
ncbi:MAG: hypothetical protein QOK40_2001 [Miltoncostaeaceae bacterium]|nr:hypothetical protein [Miltoncostaeaceae bacterium]